MSTCANMAKAFTDHLALAGRPVVVLVPGSEPDAREGQVLVARAAEESKGPLIRSMFALTKGDAKWFRPALDKGRLLVQTHKPSAIIASSGAKTVCFELAARLSGEFQIPFVLDYRDPWTLNEAVRFTKWKYAKKAPKLMLAKMRERSCLSWASLVMLRSQGMAEGMVKAFPGALDSKKIMVVPNALDDRLLVGMPSFQPDNTIRIFFKGRGSGREALLKNLLTSCAELAAEKGKVQLNLLGMGEEFAGQRGPLEVTWKGGLPQLAIRDLLAQQSVLITAVPAEERGRETGMVWLYVASGRPILALAPENGDEARAVAQAKSHVILSPGATSGAITRALVELIQSPNTAQTVPPQALASTHMQLLDQRLKSLGA